MKRLLILCLFALFTLPMVAQVSTGEAPEKPAIMPTEEIAEEPLIYYRNKGSFIMSASNILIGKQRAVSMPISLQVEATAVKNFTIGPMVTYFMLKNVKQVERNQNQVQDGNMRYHQLMVGLRGSYHLMPLVQKIINKPMLVDYVDVYITSFVGYSVMFANGSKASLDFMEENETIRGGAALGVRSMVLPRFGFFVEAGYSSYGYGSFGMTVVLK